MHVMMDLETYGTRPGSVIRSIGAVAFEYGLGREFYLNIELASCLRAGLKVDDDTVNWWKRFPEAEKLLNTDPVELMTAAEAFHQFFNSVGAIYIWSHGSSFDIVLWEEACRKIGVKVPWKYSSLRDTRTWYAAHKFKTSDIPFTGTPHHALDDAKHQAICVIAAAGGGAA